MPTSWIEKRDKDHAHEVKVIEKKFADIPEGSKMLIATPKIIDNYIKDIPFGSSSNLAKMRNDLAIAYNAEKTCPVTTGIFLRIAAEAAYEEIKAGKSESEVTAFWRVVDPSMKIAAKLACGTSFLTRKRKEEGIA